MLALLGWGWCFMITKIRLVPKAQLLDICDGLQLASNWAIQVSEVESDALKVVQLLNSSSYSSKLGHICLDIKSFFRQVNSDSYVLCLVMGIK